MLFFTATKVLAYLSKDPVIKQFQHKTGLELLIIDSNNYDTYSKMFHNICDSAFVSKTYEMLAYDSIEVNDNIGIFLYSPKTQQVVTALVIDPNATDLEQKVNNVSNLDAYHFVEIVMLCANQHNNVPTASYTLFNAVIDMCIFNNRPNFFLWVAQGQKNTRASAFYSKNGFTKIPDNPSAMWRINSAAKSKRTYHKHTAKYSSKKRSSKKRTNRTQKYKTI